MTALDSRAARLALARRQFAAFHEIGQQVAINEDRQRRLLAMSPTEWSTWKRYVAQGGTPPSVATVPEMLLRLANASYRLAVRAERAPSVH